MLTAAFLLPFVSYLGGRALDPGTHYLIVVRIVGTAAFMGYAFAHPPISIWYKSDWITTLKNGSTA